MPHKNGKKILGVPPMGSKPCLSEPKLGNVATALQEDSLTLRANLTIPICTRNGVYDLPGIKIRTLAGLLLLDAS